MGSGQGGRLMEYCSAPIKNCTENGRYSRLVALVKLKAVISDSVCVCACHVAFVCNLVFVIY